MIDDNGKKVLVWLHDEKSNTQEMNKAYRYVVYRFGKKERVDLDDPSKIMAIVKNGYYELPDSLEGEYQFVVTVLDRMQNESEGVKCKVKL